MVSIKFYLKLRKNSFFIFRNSSVIKISTFLLTVHNSLYNLALSLWTGFPYTVHTALLIVFEKVLKPCMAIQYQHDWKYIWNCTVCQYTQCLCCTVPFKRVRTYVYSTWAKFALVYQLLQFRSVDYKSFF